MSLLDINVSVITKNMELLKDLFFASPDSGGGSLLPPGISFDTLLPDEDSDMSELINPAASHLGLFGNKQLVDHNMNNSPLKSEDFKPHMTRFDSQECINNSDADIDCSRLSHASLSEYESLIKSSDYGQALPQVDAKHVESSILEATDRMVMAPRCHTPHDTVYATNGLPDSIQDLSEKLNPVTPTKSLDEVENSDPWTPTANLKVLMSAASPEIRNRERQKLQYLGELSIDSSTEDDPVCFDSSQSFEVHKEPTGKKRKSSKNKSKKKRGSTSDDSVAVYEDAEIDITQSQTSRKDKSLGLLCHRFLSMFPKYPEPEDNTAICLDEIAKELGVERRRIYDIINVLESVEVVSRVAKNKYVWHGKANLKHTLAKLQALAVVEGFVDQIEKVQDLDVNRDGEDDGTESVSSSNRETDRETSVEVADCNFLKNKKDKSLGILSQRFIMLFLLTRPKTVNLDLSAKIIVGDPNIDRTENAKFKTKIRRLYDIANILTSLELIKKVHVTETRGRKPAFKYVGPDIEMFAKGCCSNGPHRPSSKHSLLDCIRNPDVCTMLNAHKPQKQCVLKQSDKQNLKQTEAVRTRPPPLAKKSLARHSSFDQICEVAELERNRLYFESSRSVPTSPSKAIAAAGKKLSTSLISLPVGSKEVNDDQNMNPTLATDKPTTGVRDLKSKKMETIVVKNSEKPVKITTGKSVVLKAVNGAVSITEDQLREIIKGLGCKAVKGLGSAVITVANKAASKTSTSISRPVICNTESLTLPEKVANNVAATPECRDGSAQLIDVATQSSPDLTNQTARKGAPNSGTTEVRDKVEVPPKVKIIRVCHVAGASASLGEKSASFPRVLPSGVKRTLEKDFREDPAEIKKSKLSTNESHPICGHNVLRNYLETAPLNAVVQFPKLSNQPAMQAVEPGELQAGEIAENSPVQDLMSQTEVMFRHLPPNVSFPPTPQQYMEQELPVSWRNKNTGQGAESKVASQKLEYVNVLPPNLIQQLKAAAGLAQITTNLPQKVEDHVVLNQTVTVTPSIRHLGMYENKYASAQLEANKIMAEAAALSQIGSNSILSQAIMHANIYGTTPETRSKSQPITPSQYAVSPAVVVPDRPVSLEAPPQIIETPPTLAVDPNLVVPQPKVLMSTQLPTGAAFVSPLAANIAGNLTSTMIFSSSGISPLQHLADPLMASTSEQLLFPNLDSPGCDVLQKTSTPNFPIVRPAGGYQPTSRNIINLVPFLSSPGSKDYTEVTSPLNLCLSAGNNGQVREPLIESKVQQGNLPNTATTSQTSSAFCTPTSVINPITVNGKPVATPGCYFRSTPGGLQQIAGFSGHNSAFKVVNRFTVQGSERPPSTARRLQLTINDLQQM